MEKIKAFREKAEMSQRDLAQAVGTSQAAVAQWETGATQPTLDNLRKVADVLGVSPGDLL
jgi:transcriptional regulator with XRE-family HTH domain